MTNVEQLHPRKSTYSTIRTQSLSDNSTDWLFMHADFATGIRPCFRPELMEEMWSVMSASRQVNEQQSNHELRHFVLASDANAFNLGGDLNLFAHLIRSGNRERLLTYAKRCIDGVHHLHSGGNGNIRSIALVQGDALGGGLEIALACHTIVAEEGSGMGLPEVLFGLFPGMGAYSFLRQRVTAQVAEKIILEGRIYSAEEMYALGVVDVLVPRGQGVTAVEDLIRHQRRVPHSYLAMNAVRNVSKSAVSYEELIEITEIWVDTALALGDKSLRTMDRLVKAQTRRASLEMAC